MANGHGPSIRIFTEISKIPFVHLQKTISKLFQNSVMYVDNIYLQEETHQLALIIFQTLLNY